MYKRNFEEYKELNDNPITNCGVTVGLVNEASYDDWKITLIGPQDTYYKNGLFILNIHFPPEYPNKAPEVFFITPIYHLNVNPTAPKKPGDESLGHVCISTLNWWNPQYTMREVLLNIYSLLYAQNIESPYGIDRAKEYKEEEDVFFEKVKFFVKKYGSPQNCNNNYNRNQDWDFTL